MDLKIGGTGEKKVTYTCKLPYLNRARLRLEATVRDTDKRVLAFAVSSKAPIVFIERNDIPEDDKSALDSATGLLVRNGSWQESDI